MTVACTVSAPAVEALAGESFALATPRAAPTLAVADVLISKTPRPAPELKVTKASGTSAPDELRTVARTVAGDVELMIDEPAAGTTSRTTDGVSAFSVSTVVDCRSRPATVVAAVMVTAPAVLALTARAVTVATPAAVVTAVAALSVNCAVSAEKRTNWPAPTDWFCALTTVALTVTGPAENRTGAENGATLSCGVDPSTLKPTDSCKTTP